MTTNHRITTTALLIASLAAAGAPAASAMPIGGDPATAVNSAPSVYSHQDKSLVPATSPSPSGGAIANVSASQSVVRPNPDEQTVSPASSSPSRGARTVQSNPDEQTAELPASSPTAVVRVMSPNGGFDWGDAGIGAAGGFALSMLGIGGALALSQRHTRRAQTALTS